MDTDALGSHNFHISRKLILVVTAFLIGGSLLVVLTNFSINLMSGFSNFTLLLNRQSQIHQAYLSRFTDESRTADLGPSGRSLQTLEGQHTMVQNAARGLLKSETPDKIIKNQKNIGINFTELSALLFVFRHFKNWDFVRQIHYEWDSLEAVSRQVNHYTSTITANRDSSLSLSLDAQQHTALAQLERGWQSQHQDLMTSVNRASLTIKQFGLWLSVILGILLVLVGIIVTVRASKSIHKWEESLREKEILLSEIHHRVKNNLAVISGLLDIEEMNNGNPQQALTDSRDRIQSMAMIHEILYNADSLTEINMQQYGEKLIHHIKNSYLDASDDIRIQTEFSPIDLNINQAVPLGLILNEYLTNAIQHAFPDSRGHIQVSLSRDGRDILLEVQDDGQGLPEEVSLDSAESTGFSIISALIQQLDGEVELSDNNGARFKLSFVATDRSGSSSHHF